MPQAEALLNRFDRVEGDFLGVDPGGDGGADDGLFIVVAHAGLACAFDQCHTGPDPHQDLHQPRQLGFGFKSVHIAQGAGRRIDQPRRRASLERRDPPDPADEMRLFRVITRGTDTVVLAQGQRREIIRPRGRGPHPKHVPFRCIAPFRVGHIDQRKLHLRAGIERDKRVRDGAETRGEDLLTLQHIALGRCRRAAIGPPDPQQSPVFDHLFRVFCLCRTAVKPDQAQRVNVAFPQAAHAKIGRADLHQRMGGAQGGGSTVFEHQTRVAQNVDGGADRCRTRLLIPGRFAQCASSRLRKDIRLRTGRKRIETRRTVHDSFRQPLAGIITRSSITIKPHS